VIRADLTRDAEAGAQSGGDGRAAGTAHVRAVGCGARLDVIAHWQRAERGVESWAGALVQLQAHVRAIAHARETRCHDAVMLACDGRTGPSVSCRHGERLEETRWHGRKGNWTEA
jgi:hypothetical protein